MYFRYDLLQYSKDYLRIYKLENNNYSSISLINDKNKIIPKIDKKMYIFKSI